MITESDTAEIVAEEEAPYRGAAFSIEDEQALLRQLFNLAPAGIVIGSLSDGCILDANAAFCNLIGYEREEVVGRTSLELELWDAPRERIALLRRLREEKTLRQQEIVLCAKDGSKVAFLGSYQVIRLRGEDCLLAVLNDMSQRKKVEDRLLSMKRQAEELARIRTSILTNVTHEVRTPLTVILGFTSVLREGVREEYHRFIQLIERSGRRLLLMLDTILDLAQLEAGTLKPHRRRFDVNELVEKVVNDRRPFVDGQKLELDVRLPANILYFSLDHEIFSRVLSNLLDNAIKFTKEGQVVVEVEEENDRLLVRVIDTGVGIKEEYLPDIFNEFSQASTGLERTHQGVGLGLVVSKRLIEQLGGTLSVQSKAGEGSIFTVSFPRED